MSEPSQELAVVEQSPSAQLAPIGNPAEFVAGYVAVADQLSKVIRDKNLFKRIGAKDHVLVEGWTLLGSMLGVFPVTVWTRQVGDNEGWEARVEARTRDGAVVGAAEAECLRTESTWRSRDDYALRSMAQTRATSKALRQPLGFVMTLAGLAATPAEEMDGTSGSAEKPTKRQLDYLRSLLQQHNYSTSTIQNRALEDLSRSEVSEFIEQLKAGTGVGPEIEPTEEELAELDDIPF